MVKKYYFKFDLEDNEEKRKNVFAYVNSAFNKKFMKPSVGISLLIEKGKRPYEQILAIGTNLKIATKIIKRDFEDYFDISSGSIFIKDSNDLASKTL